MNKLKYFLAFAAASLMLGAGPAMAVQLNASFTNSVDNGMLYNGSSHDAVARADAPLNLNLVDDPDIVAEFLNVSYDSVNDLLTVSGFALNYVDPAGDSALINPAAVFVLTASIDGNGILSGGDFQIVQTPDPVNDPSTTILLLAGTLEDLGYAAIGGTLEFLFSVDDGTLAADYGGIGALGGMIMTFTGFAGDWNTDFVNSGTDGRVDISPLAAPEPGILLLGGLGLTLIAATRRRKV